jgi:DnaK suppressor protein
MKKKDLEKFSKLLIEEKRKILRHLEELSASSGEDLDLSTGDSADIASLEISQATMQKVGKRETMLLKKIDKALKKVADGTYGECESCGEEISVARLEARPVAELCIDCKTDQESQERRYRQEVGHEEEEGISEESEEG